MNCVFSKFFNSFSNCNNENKIPKQNNEPVSRPPTILEYTTYKRDWAPEENRDEPIN